MNVAVITIHHKHGVDVIVGENQKAAQSGLEGYCREWIADFTEPAEGYVNEAGQWVSDEDIVDVYFRLAGEEEYFESTTVDVIPAVPA